MALTILKSYFLFYASFKTTKLRWAQGRYCIVMATAYLGKAVGCRIPKLGALAKPANEKGSSIFGNAEPANRGPSQT